MMRYKIIPVTPFEQNCTLIWCERTQQAALIDPGGEVDKLLREVDKAGVQLQKILLTHGHLDHVGGTAELIKRMGVPVEGPHREDQFWISALDEQAQMMGFAAVDGFAPGRWLDEGDQVELGEIVLHVLHCPGHTPGHVVFFQKEQRLLFVGDVLFRGSIGRTDFPRGNYDQLICSIREKVFAHEDDVTIFPGHGPMTTIGHEKAHNPFVADNQFG